MEKIADIKDAWTIAMVLPIEAKGQGITKFWSDQIERDAPTLPAEIADVLWKHLASKRANAAQELRVDLHNLERENEVKQRENELLKQREAELEDASNMLAVTVTEKDAKIAENQERIAQLEALVASQAAARKGTTGDAASIDREEDSSNDNDRATRGGGAGRAGKSTRGRGRGRGRASAA